jgi:hypothetical protein
MASTAITGMPHRAPITWVVRWWWWYVAKEAFGLKESGKNTKLQTLMTIYTIMQNLGYFPHFSSTLSNWIQIWGIFSKFRVQCLITKVHPFSGPKKFKHWKKYVKFLKKIWGGKWPCPTPPPQVFCTFIKRPYIPKISSEVMHETVCLKYISYQFR